MYRYAIFIKDSGGIPQLFIINYSLLIDVLQRMPDITIKIFTCQLQKHPYPRAPLYAATKLAGTPIKKAMINNATVSITPRTII